MGMFDKPVFLTGKDGWANVGEVFWLHNARIDGKTKNPKGEVVDQGKFLLSKTRDGEKVVVLSSGTGLVNQIRAMDDNDRRALPMAVRLDEIPSDNPNPTRVLTPASQPPPSDGPPSDGASNWG